MVTATLRAVEGVTTLPFQRKETPMRKTALLAAFVGVSVAAPGCVSHEKEVVVEKPVAPRRRRSR